ncbi:MAG: Nitroreductase family protein [Firmicutes bacterium]|nr:Nitroreductase family protein [Bacillota bacterium]
MFHDIVKKNRSYRRFYEHEKIARQDLLKLIDYARLTPSGANWQALKYYLACEPELNSQVFPTLAWAGYFKAWPGPVAGERPAAYIVIVQDEEYKMSSPFDCGIAAQTILLGAVEMGLGGCMFGSIQRSKLKEVLNIPDHQEILLAIAIGKPKEQIVIEEIPLAGDIKYWRDDNQIHHVPKRRLEDIILN